mgnify:CR=1 FL=1
MPQTKESLISPRPPCVARLGIFAGYIFTIVHNIVWSLLVLLKWVHLNHRDAWEQVAMHELQNHRNHRDAWEQVAMHELQNHLNHRDAWEQVSMRYKINGNETHPEETRIQKSWHR